MTKVTSLLPKMFARHSIECTSTFENIFDSVQMPKSQKRRIIRFFSKKTPNKFMRLREQEGFSEDEVLLTLFGKRFGKHLILYRIKFIHGKLKIKLMDLVKIVIRHLRIIATHLKNRAEGGETLFYNDFEVYECFPTLCVDPLRAH